MRVPRITRGCAESPPREARQAEELSRWLMSMQGRETDAVEPDRGVLVALEGIDGAGKSTQTTLLRDRLRTLGFDANILRVPTPDSPLREAILASIRDPSFDPYARQALFAAERLRHRAVADRIPKGCVLIADRYKHSSRVYGLATGLQDSWVSGLESPMPDADITVLLDIPAETARLRLSKPDALEGDLEMQTSCRRLYAKLAREMSWPIIDAISTSALVAEQIWLCIEERFAGAI